MRNQNERRDHVFRGEEEVLDGLSLRWLIGNGLIMVQATRIAFAEQRICTSELFLTKAS